MPHEERTAACFAEKGFGMVVDIKDNWRKEVLDICENMKSYELRNHMCMKGKTISDGSGRRRIVEIINRI